MENKDIITCKGSYVLGTACGNCPRCADEKAKIDANVEKIERAKRVPFSVQFDGELIYEMLQSKPKDQVIREIMNDMFTESYITEVVDALIKYHEEKDKETKTEEGTV